MNHRVFLPPNHAWRVNKKSFNGKKEFGFALTMLEGIEILKILKDFKNYFGKNKKKMARGKRDQSFFSFPIGHKINYDIILM